MVDHLVIDEEFEAEESAVLTLGPVVAPFKTLSPSLKVLGGDSSRLFSSIHGPLQTVERAEL